MGSQRAEQEMYELLETRELALIGSLSADYESFGTLGDYILLYILIIWA